MIPEFVTRDVSSWPVHSAEPLGSKDKEWLRLMPEGELWLFKRCRSDAGDDWAEKAAEQIANLIRLPHAEVQLATRGGSRGVICRDFRQVKASTVGVFVPGNELLWEADSSYPKAVVRGASQYTVSRSLDILARLQAVAPRTGVHWDETMDATEFFVGYLMFDAWIGNLDRHHENWGVVKMNQDQDPRLPVLGPSFDHGSSLGQNENDEKRGLRLRTRDQKATIEAWARTKAVSRFYLSESDGHPCKTLDAFGQAAAAYPHAARNWLQRLENVDLQAVKEIVFAVPDPLLSEIGKQFTVRLLDINRRDLLSLLSMNLVRRVLFVAWQNPSTRSIFPVARLLHLASSPRWEFVYIEGARKALEHGFELFHGFGQLGDVSRSDELPPLFTNRLMRSNRADFPAYMERLGLAPEAEVIPVLARSEGLRASDPIELFGLPTFDAARKRYRFFFFLRGIRHVPGAEECIATLKRGDVLDLEPDPKNPVDGLAICVHGGSAARMIGWVPATLLEDLHDLQKVGSELSVTVERINPLPGPVQTRVLCRLEATFVEGFVPLATERYQPIPTGATHIHIEPAALVV